IFRSLATTRSGIQLQTGLQFFEPVACTSSDLLEGENDAVTQCVLKLCLKRRQQLVLLAHFRVRSSKVQAILNLATDFVPGNISLGLLGVPGYDISFSIS
ncbi:MAG: hypothetical protein KGL39_37980, partial [Patescibacteria group bacterium]|nr:hypothetical protein [Patescibacteria group bacterium]